MRRKIPSWREKVLMQKWKEPPNVDDRRNGKARDVRIPDALRFQYVKGKGKHGFALRRTDIHSDSMGAVMTFVKRGVIKMG